MFAGRKVKALLRYYQLNPNKAFETYAYHLLFLIQMYGNLIRSSAYCLILSIVGQKMF